MLLNTYIKLNQLSVEVFQRGVGWMDAGSINSLFEASDLVQVLQKRQGLRFNSPDEIAWRNSWITDSQLFENAGKYHGTDYGEYLFSLLQ